MINSSVAFLVSFDWIAYTTLYKLYYPTLYLQYILNLLIRLLILTACQKAKGVFPHVPPSSLILNSAQSLGFKSQRIISVSRGHCRQQQCSIFVHLFKRWLTR